MASATLYVSAMEACTEKCFISYYCFVLLLLFFCCLFFVFFLFLFFFYKSPLFHLLCVLGEDKTSKKV